MPKPRLKFADEFAVSPRVTLQHGDLFRISGGPVWKDESGAEHRVGPRARVFMLDRIMVRGRRVWLEAFEFDSDGVGASHILYAHGRPYKSNGILNRPYKIRRVKSKRKS